MATAKAKTGQELTAIDPETGEVTVVERMPLPSASEYGEQRRVSDLIPTPDVWAEYPQVPIADLIDRDLVIYDCMFFDSLDYEDREWAIVLYRDTDTGQLATTANGGAVVIRKLHLLQDMKRPDGAIGAFPCVGRFLAKPSRKKGQSDYFDLV